MDKSGIETIQAMAISGMENKIVDGREYSITELSDIKTPTVCRFFVYSLKSLIEAVKTLKLEDGCFCNVTSPTRVNVLRIDVDKWKQREAFLEADVSDLVNNFSFDKKMDQETFIIDVQANFVKTDIRDGLIKLASNISLEDSSSLKDNGTSQEVSVKKGISLLATTEIQNPVILIPYKTFPELSPHEQEFIFRVSKGGRYDDDTKKPMLALYESKSRHWELAVMDEIREYLRKSLPDMAVV